MKFVLLIFQGSQFGSRALSEADEKAVYADYAELNKSDGVTPAT
jgi:hypothetical protein